MNTVQQTALAQAKQGNPEALAALMRKQLEEKGIQVRVSRSGDFLTVALGSAQAPPKASSLNFVKNGLTSLGVNNIRAVQVRGHKLGIAEPTWIDRINLATPSVTLPTQQPRQDKNDDSDTSSHHNSIDPIRNFIKSKNGERLAISLTTFLLTSLAWAVFLRGDDRSSRNAVETAQKTEATSSEVQAEDSSPTEEPPSRIFLVKHLDEITQAGSSGLSNWCTESQSFASSLFSPRNYEILSFNQWSDELATANVRIESSNKGGLNIIQDWSFSLDHPKTENETGAQLQSWCILTMND